jgi:hypothetical protein
MTVNSEERRVSSASELQTAAANPNIQQIPDTHGA